MNENAEYLFRYQPLEDGIDNAATISEGLANALARDGWTIDHALLNGSFLVLIFWRPRAAHQTTDRGEGYKTE